MRTVIAGNGTDSTAAVLAWLAANNELALANLILIGEPEDPNAIWLTDWESPLSWPIVGTFQAAVISRSAVATSIGFKVGAVTLKWSPLLETFTSNTQTASPYQLARQGFYDNWRVWIWTAYMPTPGDANTYGASALFGGRIGNVTVQRGEIQFSVTSFLDVVNQQVPTNVIEVTNTLAAYTGATPPAGTSEIPQFNCIIGSTQTKLYLQETSPTADHIFADNVLRGGFVAFNAGGSQTLGGIYGVIYANTRVTISSVDYNEIVLYAPLPWAPTPGTDTAFISGSAPLDPADGQYQGFRRVPSPNSSV